MQQVKLAEALLRRKELHGKVDALAKIKKEALFEVRAQRVKITDSIDEVVAHVPVLRAGQVTEEHDFYARQLRLIDAAIQQANWTTEIAVADTVMGDYRKAE